MNELVTAMQQIGVLKSRRGRDDERRSIEIKTDKRWGLECFLRPMVLHVNKSLRQRLWIGLARCIQSERK
jgi:hypothetical protein